MRPLYPLIALTFLATIGTVNAAPKVVSSIAPVNSLVASVMKGIGEPELLLPLSASPHAYALRPSQARSLAEADIVFWVGEGIETFLIRPLENLSAKATKVSLLTADGLTIHMYREGHDDHDKHDDHDDHDDHDKHDDHSAHDDHDHEGEDPHIWLDPRNAAAMVRVIAETLAARDPGNAAQYKQNAAAVLSELEALEGEIASILADSRGKPFVVFHDAYQYFESRFNLRKPLVITVSPETPPGARRVAELQAQIKKTGAKCIFLEPQFDSRVALALTNDSDLRAGVLDPLGSLPPKGFSHYHALLTDMARTLDACLSRP